jgi:hypothetical protein
MSSKVCQALGVFVVDVAENCLLCHADGPVDFKKHPVQHHRLAAGLDTMGNVTQVTPQKTHDL